VSPEGARFCQFCGNSSFVQPGAAVVPPAPGFQQQAGPGDFFSSVLKLKDLPANGFRWLPFLFNVSYLAGYGNTKEAWRTMGLILAGYLLSYLLFAFGLDELGLLSVLGTVGFTLWYSYMISTHIDALVTRDRAFNWTVAAGFWLVYAIVSSVLTSNW
jgi:hypothetical protein